MRVRVEGLGDLEYPDGMSREDMEKAIRAHPMMQGQTPQSPVTPDISPAEHQMLGFIQPQDIDYLTGKAPFPAPRPEGPSISGQIGRGFVEQLPVGGAMVGGVLGSTLGPFGAAGGAGLGMTTGTFAKNLIKRVTGDPTTPTPEQNLWEGAKAFPMGVIGEVGGPWIVNKVAKIFAPAMGRISDSFQRFAEFMKENKLPMPPDILGTPVGKASRKLADAGLGSFLVDRQRQRMLSGISEAADDVIGSLGIKTASEAGQEAAQGLASLGNMELTYTQYNAALKAIPKDKMIPMPGIISALESASKLHNRAMEGAISKEFELNEGLKAVARIYTSKQGKEAKLALQNIVRNGGYATIDDLMILSRDVRRGFGGKSEYLADRMKKGLLEDLETIFAPNGQNLKILREAADQVMSDTYKFLREIGMQTGLVFKGDRGPWQATHKLEIGPMVERLFRKDYLPVTEKLRDRLLANDMGHIWDGMKLGYLKDVFEKSAPAIGQAGERVFQPSQFLRWYNQNGETAMRLMPEHFQSIRLWADIARNTQREFAKKTTDPASKLAVTGFLGGAGYLGAGSAGIAVPTLFSPMAAIFTMYPNVDFLTRYATRGQPGIIGDIVSQSAGFMGRKALQDYGPMSIEAVNEQFIGGGR